MQAQTSTINSEQMNLGAFLSDKRQLKVPAYQRNFYWTVSEITDFWEDLQDIICEDRENYFWGSEENNYYILTLSEARYNLQILEIA